MPIDLSLSTHPKSSITRHTVKILGVICNNLVKLLGGCLHRRKNVEAGGHGAHSMRRFQEYLDEEQKTYRLGELMSSIERETCSIASADSTGEISSINSKSMLQLRPLPCPSGLTSQSNLEKFPRLTRQGVPI